MNLIRYFSFYYKLTEGRLLLFIGSAGISVFFEMLTAASFLTVLQFGTNNESNRITRFVYEMLKLIGITETRDSFIFLLFFATVTIFMRSIFEIISGIYVARLDSMIFINNRDLKVMQLILQQIITNSEISNLDSARVSGKFQAVVSPETIKAAITMVTTIPIIMVYPFLQKYFVKGLIIGAIKG